MIISIFAYLFISIGVLILFLPLVLVELSRPRDWLAGGIFLFLGLFLSVENDFLRDSVDLLVISMTILFGIMLLEIIQNRWYQLSLEEKKRISSLERWIESFKQLSQIFGQILNGSINSFKSFKNESKKPLTEKKWVRPERKEKKKKKEMNQSNTTNAKKVINQELTENDETS
tara:strand:+ start:229 stop:747 length:519 start_codon:yes stop_codon:yes gene_type:complete